MIVHPRYLLPEQARKIKALLWAGHMSQPEIAALYKTHQTGISRILNGHIWQEIEWPDGSKGCMNPDRYKVITSSRKRSARYGGKRKDQPSKEVIETLSKVQKILLSKPHNRYTPLLSEALCTEDEENIGEGEWCKSAWKCISWDDPFNSVVRESEKGTPNTELRVAACFILHNIPFNEWSRRSVIEAIYKLSHWIENNP